MIFGWRKRIYRGDAVFPGGNQYITGDQPLFSGERVIEYKNTYRKNLISHQRLLIHST
ncbi:hypothetical protein [Fictibacillus norfolkensis]|uniref:Uncharacterized protein n=1 Tax=Fictibacillus norfolkensis TaxID=2762233 RepID=A0ABR8SPI8_9BACL|nr:hypothetical protein [Fictibacillus norfolkensis]MBD7965367.1 hypothetical protein [Fictibacillus norfolkensis]